MPGCAPSAAFTGPYPATRPGCAPLSGLCLTYPRDKARVLVMTAVPWTLCCLAFSGLYWTYLRNKARVRPYRTPAAVPGCAP